MLCWHDKYLLCINSVITWIEVERNDFVLQVSDFSDGSFLLTGTQQTFKWKLVPSPMLRRAQPQIQTFPGISMPSLFWVTPFNSVFLNCSDPEEDSTTIQQPVDKVQYPREFGSSVTPLREPQFSKVSVKHLGGNTGKQHLWKHGFQR
jgi:hypothetical protein